MLSTFLVFNTAITIPLSEVSAAVAAEPKGYENEEEEGSYDYPPERDMGIHQ